MMPEISLVGGLIVAAVAFVVPLALGLVPALRVPSVVVEIVAGIVIGPAGQGRDDDTPFSGRSWRRSASASLSRFSSS